MSTNGTLRALVWRGGSWLTVLSVRGAHEALEPFADAHPGGDWDDVQILYEELPPHPPTGEGLWELAWPWHEVTADEHAAQPELCCVYDGAPVWRHADVERLFASPVLPPAAPSEPGPTVRDVAEVYGVPYTAPPAAPSEDANERFERLAAEFYEDTGFLAPGKDYPAAALVHDEVTRELVWQAWRRGRDRGGNARPLSARPECVEAVARALLYRRFPKDEWTSGRPATEQALEDVREVRAAERAASDTPRA